MSAPRVQFLLGMVSEAGAAVAFRVLGGNNRELGRSAHAYPTLVAAQQAASALRGLVEELVPVTIVDADTGLWSWKVVLSNDTIMVSGRSYQRRREADSNLQRLLEALPSVLVTDELLDRRRTANGRGARRAPTNSVHPALRRSVDPVVQAAISRTPAVHLSGPEGP